MRIMSTCMYMYTYLFTNIHACRYCLASEFRFAPPPAPLRENAGVCGVVCVVLANQTKEERTKDTRALVGWLRRGLAPWDTGCE